MGFIDDRFRGIDQQLLTPPRPRSDPGLPGLEKRLREARRRTLDLIQIAAPEDLARSWNPDFSPIRWHLGHIAAFEDRWVGRNVGGLDPIRPPDFERLFDPATYSKPERVDLPEISDIREYLHRVRDRTRSVLRRVRLDHPNSLLRRGFVGELIYEHECQHQEIMCTVLQQIPPERKTDRRPAVCEELLAGRNRGLSEPDSSWIEFPGGSVPIGALPWRFSYDNEREPHWIALEPFAIMRDPVTELEFAEFIEDGGYRTPSLWSEEGWRWVRTRGIAHPRDWSWPDGDSWQVRTMFEWRPVAASVPVQGVSHHEAQAFARWIGARLPTEFEWEAAASWDPRSGSKRRFPWGDALLDADQHNLNGHQWGTCRLDSAPTSPVGCRAMAGQVWEWTDSRFAPYPGFRAHPYPQYSSIWFDQSHYVVRGGSWATAAVQCRASFRNWYQPHLREPCLGFRCARDLTVD